MKKYAVWMWIALVIAFDQVTKHVVRTSLAPGESHNVISGLMNLTYVQNIGAAWGILAGWRVVLVALAVAMLVFISVKRRRIFGEGAVAQLSFILLFGGIVGNMIDRAVCGFVTDFLDFYIGTSHFPSFNVADSCICIGVGLYMILNLRQSGRDAIASKDPAAGE